MNRIVRAYRNLDADLVQKKIRLNNAERGQYRKVTDLIINIWV